MDVQVAKYITYASHCIWGSTDQFKILCAEFLFYTDMINTY